jgi:hypothetical protein
MSEPEVFGKEALLAIASLLFKTDSTDVRKIAQQSKLILIELCAKSLLKKNIDCSTDSVSGTTSTCGIELGRDNDLMHLSDELFQQIPDSACEDALSGAFWLMSVYEHLTSFRLEVDDAGWCLTPSVGDKRKRGQYFTPRNLTQLATRSALQKLFELKVNVSESGANSSKLARITALKIVDPAMGAGAFLVCALDFMANKLDSTGWKEIAENCLYGVDLDETAGGVTYLVLALFCSLKLGSHVLEDLPGLKNHLKAGNSLLGCWTADGALTQRIELDRVCLDAFSGDQNIAPNIFHWQLEFKDIAAKGGFDAVLCNPPWETLKPNVREFFSTQEKKFFEGFGRYLKTSGERARYLKTKYGINRPFKAQGNADLNSYKLFAELAYCLLADNGCMSLIVPSGIYTDQ